MSNWLSRDVKDLRVRRTVYKVLCESLVFTAVVIVIVIATIDVGVK